MLIFTKDPEAIVDYEVDWSTWLGSDTLASSTWMAPSGITVTSSTGFTTTKATIWLSGGTNGSDYVLTNTITTAGGRTEDETVVILCRQNAHILTVTEAANVLRCATTDVNMLDLLPLVDGYIEQATGREWQGDAIIEPLAKAAARMLLTMWHENPAMTGQAGSLHHGLHAVLLQLEGKALALVTNGVPDEALALTASNPADGAVDVALAVAPVLVFNHKMASGATSAVSLKTAAGATVTTTKTLDATGKIMTITPSANLTSGAKYTIDIQDAADEFGATIEKELSFTAV